MKRFLSCSFLAAAIALGAPACSSGDNSPPDLEPIADQIASVNSELRVVLRASDPDGDAVKFKYKVDIGDISDRAGFEAGAAKGTAVFKWTPIGSDVGLRTVDFIASDGKDESRRTVTVDVRSATGSATSPVFRQPLGTGTTLDLQLATCVTVPIEIEDSDSPGVQLGQEPPLIDGATLNESGGLTGSWEWCPTPEQADKELHKLILSAYDGDNPKVLKEYLIVVQKPVKSNCPGQAPVVTHTPKNESTVVDLTIDALVSDDKGLKFAPLLLYSATDPGPTPDLSKMTQVTMMQIDGDMQNGTWAADVPNPVASQPQGASADVFYVIVARDNDDEIGDCDHITTSPEPGSHKMTVTNPGGTGGLSTCASCTKDVQCGGAGDNCIYIGTGGKSYCGKACTSNSQCPSGYSCSPTAVLSVESASSRQCVPDSQTCGGTTTTCKDDQYEENDTLNDVKTKPALPPGTYPVMSCPGAIFDDEDWYPIDITTETNVTASISGGSASNLDLFLKDSTGTKIASSTSNGSSETVKACLKPGRHYFHVWAWSSAENPYTLTWSKSGACTAACVDDSAENDDNLSQAKAVNLPPVYKKTGQICSMDDDWFKVPMFKDETLKATLKFTQTKFSEDLDLYVYDSTGKQLTVCTELDPFLCDPANGQSGTSNENLSWPITTSGDYYVVVHGWEGSQNSYEICIDYTSSSKTTNGCPPL